MTRSQFRHQGLHASLALAACFTLTLISCADKEDVGTSTTGNDSTSSAVEATDACFTACIERGGDEATCAEACARIGGDSCYEGCIERGGDETDCREVCSGDSADSCYDGCIARGGDDVTCREACAERGERDCFTGCVEASGSEEDCRARCAEADSETAPSGTENRCEEGDTVDRGDETYICVDGEWVLA
ncbi:MAG: hypothetical protein HOI23_14255 [Deltaproteobacteria bacterium]|jgi:hypothetical protein|nr:hypothetical protein [Deltaproteobacteria bacterium]MBT6434647.1 hypothetical protein [Deltaproteobacteria bacterium]